MFARKVGLAVAVAAVMGIGQPAGAEGVSLQWFGQSAFKIVSPRGKVIVVDPFLTKNPKTPDEFKDLSKLGKVDLILVTHGHGDHVGDTFELAKLTGAKVAMNADMGSTYSTLGVIDKESLIRFNKSGPITPLGDGITVTMTHAEHSSSVTSADASGNPLMLPGGEPAGYVIELENGFKIYHAGDTGVFGDMRFISSYYRPDLALLPIGGYFTMGPEHAAYALSELMTEVPAVVPMHFGTFPPLAGTPEALKAALGDHKVEVVVMTPGETRSF